MIGLGPVYDHTRDQYLKSENLGGEAALDLMWWPFRKRKFGWYVELEYEYSFKTGHDQSIGISGGLLIGI